MASEAVLFAGTAGQAVWRSLDGGESFRRHSAGMFMEAEVRALAVDPFHPNRLYAGTDAGLFRTDDLGDHWSTLDAPFDPGRGWQAGVIIWSLLIHPTIPDLLFFGTCPPAIYRSTDAGSSWVRLEAGIDPDCAPIIHSRVTCLRADPENPRTIWAGVEIDGAWRSDDLGDTWAKCAEGLSSADIHDIAIVPGASGRVLAATNNDLNLSEDGGATWQPQGVGQRFPNRYCRGLLQIPGAPEQILLGNGDGPPGGVGSVQISRDGGLNWTQAYLPVMPNSTVWCFAANAALPGLLYAAAINGYVYRSEDGGATWAKCAHEFGEVRSLALMAR